MKADVSIEPGNGDGRTGISVDAGARSGASLSAPDFLAILASTGQAAYVWDLESDALSWSENAVTVLAAEAPEAIATGRAFARRLLPDTPVTRFDAVTGAKEPDTGSGVPYRIEYALERGGAEPLWIEDTGRWFAGHHGRPQRAHGLVRAVNERRAREQQLTDLCQRDELTGEINRGALTKALAEAVAAAVADRTACGFLLVGLDNLARVNESFGFDVADEVIRAVASRLRARLRGGDTLGRFSGNKFGVVLKTCSAEELAVAAERLLASVRDDVLQTSAGPVPMTVTISGVAAPRHARTAEDVLARAQETLDRAKKKQPGSFLAYRPSVEHEASRRENARVTDEIVRALNERRVVLAFEPVVDARSREPAFFEALMRVRREDESLILAEAVVPAAERLGLVRLIDCRVLELVLAELSAHPALRLSFNVSSGSTADPDWWGRIEAQLRPRPELAQRLTIEITETARILDVEEMRGFVRRAKAIGCRIALDDFGAGFTSFRNLRTLDVDLVKIDGAFVRSLVLSKDDQVFVRTLLELCRGLGVATVAEWVGSEEAATMLTDWGCDYLQGEMVGLASVDPPWALRERRVAASG